MLPRRRKQAERSVTESIDEAVRASEQARERLIRAREVLAVQNERARVEHGTIIAAIRKMREANNLARLILDSVEQEAGNDAGAASG